MAAQPQIRLTNLLKSAKDSKRQSMRAFGDVQGFGNRAFKDIVINRKAEPELYNIRVGLDMIERNVDGYQKGALRTGYNDFGHGPGSTYKAKMADSLMRQLGIGVVLLPKEHTLLHCQDSKPEEENQEIFDEQEFLNLENQLISVKDKFSQKDDPIFQLDEEPATDSQNLQKEINKDTDKDSNTFNQDNYEDFQGQYKQTPDMSNLAASIVQLNLSDKFVGKTKYFKEATIVGGKSEFQNTRKRYRSAEMRYKQTEKLYQDSPYYVAHPNKEDAIAQMITLDQQSNTSGKNVGQYVENIKVLNRQGHDSEILNRAGTQQFGAYEGNATESGQTANSQGQGGGN